MKKWGTLIFQDGEAILLSNRYHIILLQKNFYLSRNLKLITTLNFNTITIPINDVMFFVGIVFTTGGKLVLVFLRFDRVYDRQRKGP